MIKNIYIRRDSNQCHVAFLEKGEIRKLPPIEGNPNSKTILNYAIMWFIEYDLFRKDITNFRIVPLESKKI